MNAVEILNVLRTAAVADALGVPAEMKTRGSYELKGMTGGGTWSQPTGSWSDDTSMTLCLLQNVVKQGSYDDLLDKFECYMMFGKWTPRGETFDVGRTCAHAVRQHAINHLPALQCGDSSEQANGNGALMRIAPLVFVLAETADVSERFKVTRAFTMVTHGHSRAVVGSFIYLEILRALLLGQSLAAALVTVQKILAKLNPRSTYVQEVPAYHRLFLPEFDRLSIKEIKTSGYVVDTLEAAVWVALNKHGVQEGLLTAVNLGGDVDTIATVAAPLLTLANPGQHVPEAWWQATLNHKLLDQVMIPFAEKFGN